MPRAPVLLPGAASNDWPGQCTRALVTAARRAARNVRSSAVTEGRREPWTASAEHPGTDLLRPWVTALLRTKPAPAFRKTEPACGRIGTAEADATRPCP